MDLLRTDGICGLRNGGCEREDLNCLGKSSESTEDVLNKSEVNQAYKFLARSFGRGAERNLPLTNKL